MAPSTKQDGGSIDNEDECVAHVKPLINDVLSSVLTTLGISTDIQRGITRIFHRTATTFESGYSFFVSMIQFIAVVHTILYARKQLQQLQVEHKDSNEELQKKTAFSLIEKDAADQKDLQNLFIASDGQFPEVARSQTTVEVANHKLDSLISMYRKQLGVRNLDFIGVSGSTHLIELRSDLRLPSNWVKVNSTKRTIRYHPPEVLKALDELLLAKEELALACRSAWDRFLEGFSKYYAEFPASVQALAAGLRENSEFLNCMMQNYVRPVFVNDTESVQIHIHSGRHPVLDLILQDSFVPNDTNLNAEGEYCQIVTGPNMGGNSCYIHQVALLCIMAQEVTDFELDYNENMEHGDITFLYKVVPGTSDKSFGLNVARLAQQETGRNLFLEQLVSKRNWNPPSNLSSDINIFLHSPVRMSNGN
ncbi:hypothetical protein IFM89_010034 [Coptis chinensis]|uniref:Uncharacterized protein n=1 Tax=Coptis chinensis TaxID=261450 RepID=A0A835LLZ5_9MAGN|nr:hypothetical protein IFM89_010034 [Coptis chinensis]